MPDARIGFPDATPQSPSIDAALQVLPCVEGNAQAINPDDDTCYLLFSSVITWQAAQAACLAAGATLAVVDNAAEQALVGGLAGSFPAGAPDLWLGATDEVSESVFVWVDGNAMTFQNWRSGEPNNDGPGSDPENCLVIEGDTAQRTWDDRSCLVAAPYICERTVR